ncbi:hypothetical protein D3C80_2195490 [compost metagenome]
MMAKGDRLSNLKMSEPRHNRIDMLLSKIREGADQVLEFDHKLIELSAGIKLHVG